MANEFKELLGNRIYVEIPETPESSIILDESSKKAQEEKQMRAYDRLKVYAVGEGVSNIKPGDYIMLDPSMKTTFIGISLSDNKIVALVSYFNICHIW